MEIFRLGVEYHKVNDISKVNLTRPEESSEQVAQVRHLGIPLGIPKIGRTPATTVVESDIKPKNVLLQKF